MGLNIAFLSSVINSDFSLAPESNGCWGLQVIVEISETTQLIIIYTHTYDSMYIYIYMWGDI